MLSATVPQPAGFAVLGQEMFADDYRGAAITFRGQFRARDVAGSGAASRAGLFLRFASDPGDAVSPGDAANGPGTTILAVPGDRDWAAQQVTARVPEDCDTVTFGVFLAGRGRIELRDAELARAT